MFPKEDLSDTTELEVIPDKNIFVLPNEYVTVSLNVEYRNDSKCTIQTSKLVNIIFKKIIKNILN